MSIRVGGIVEPNAQWRRDFRLMSVCAGGRITIPVKPAGGKSLETSQAPFDARLDLDEAAVVWNKPCPP
jgi:hypothetical protein